MVGAGVIGSLFAGHLAREAEVSVLTRRREHADALNEEGLHVTGRSDRLATVTASDDPDDLPEPEDLATEAISELKQAIDELTEVLRQLGGGNDDGAPKGAGA